MVTQFSPYLGFRGTARSAMELYRSVFGGTLEVSTYGELELAHASADTDLVLHAELRTDWGMVLMAADAPSATPYREGPNGAVAVYGDDEARLRGYWEGLTDRGQVDLPLAPAPWGDIFGMCTDTFGVGWMICVQQPA